MPPAKGPESVCGINGILSHGQGAKHAFRMSAMNHALRHRGPDDEGVFQDDDVVLGHRRLAIVCLGEGGHQPMPSPDRQVWVVFNGEIYNFRSLRAQLEGLGAIFRTTSDTEVLTHGFQYWNEGLFDRLEGMFAIGVWDRPRKRLFLARDGCGVKPLFYSHDPACGLVIFSSEIKGILASGLVSRTLNPAALSQYLSLFYIPSPTTPFLEIRQVEPGQVLRFATDGSVQEHHFWGVADLAQAAADLAREAPSEALLLERLQHETAHAVGSSLEADVPLCLLLSAGLDSASLLAELKALGRTDVTAVTIGFADAAYDESAPAARLAKEFGFNHHVLPFNDARLSDQIAAIVHHLDCLNANPCLLAEYNYFQRVAQEFKVALMGSGNDELLAGYATYQADRLRRHYGRLPMPARRMLAGAASWLPAMQGPYALDYLARKFTEGGMFSPARSHYHWRTIFSDSEKEAVLQPDLRQAMGENLDAFPAIQQHFQEAEKYGLAFPEQALYADFRTFLIDNANLEVDMLSMAFSLEVRPPFLTKRFVTQAFALPYTMKLRGNVTKYALRAAYRNRLPNYILQRPKRGLVTPMTSLFSPENRDYLMDRLHTREMAALFRPEALDSLVDEQRRGRNNHGYRIFTLVVLSQWLEQFMGSGPDA